MTLAIFGSSGMIGSRIFAEALRRGHHVTAVVRDPSKFESSHDRVRVVRGDVLQPEIIAELVRGHDAVLSAIGPGAAVIVGAARSFLEALPKSGVNRLVIVGGVGSLEDDQGALFIDTPDFPKEYLNQARAGCEALAIYRGNETIEWTFVCPPIWITPGKRTGKFRLGADNLMYDSSGESRISAEDFAIAFVDEVEQPRHVRCRFTVAY